MVLLTDDIYTIRHLSRSFVSSLWYNKDLGIFEVAHQSVVV